MATPKLIAPFEALLNRNIDASTPARALLASLQGRSFAIELTTPAGQLLRLRLEVRGTGLAVDTGEAPADATVRGTPFGLAALLAGRRDGRYTASGTSISGDAEVAASFEKLLGAARPDLETELARLVGGTTAHYAASTVHGLLDWGQQALRSLARSSGEFLTEEGRDLVPRAELDAFHGGVDRAREDLDRAAAHLALLETRLRQRAGQR